MVLHCTFNLFNYTYFCWVWHWCFVSLLVFQRAWLLKLLAVELHAGDISSSQHRDACQTILFNLFGQGIAEVGGGQAISPFSFQDTSENAAFRTVSKSKVLVVLIDSWFIWYYGLTSLLLILDYNIVYCTLNTLLSINNNRVDEITSKYLHVACWLGFILFTNRTSLVKLLTILKASLLYCFSQGW